MDPSSAQRRNVCVVLVGSEDEENLALRSVSARLYEEGINPFIVPYGRTCQTADVLCSIKKRRPSVVALSVAFQCLAEQFFELIREIRWEGYRGHIIVGGHFPTFEYRKILETQAGIDSVGRFEGEELMVKLVFALQDGADLSIVPNLVYRTPEGIKETRCVHVFPDLDRLPFPLRSKRAQIRLGERFATLTASRGCWHSGCLYCCIGAFHRQKERPFALRSAKNIAEEIAYLCHQKGVRLFQFHDDNFVLPTPEETHARIRSLQEALQEVGVPTDKIAFLIKARPDAVDDRIAMALRELGCVGAFLGIENASESGLKVLIRRAKVKDIECAVEALTRHGIAVTYNLLIFHPHATMAEINTNIEFAKRHEELPFDFGRAEIVAGSPLERLV